MTKLGIIGPLALVAVGIFALLAGSQIASTEEGIANSVGNLLSNTWVAIGLILAGMLLFAHSEGWLEKIGA
jgi:hypothetical protein